MLASQVGLELEHAVTRHQPARLEYSDDQVNSFLVYALKPKKASLDKPLLDFKRAVVAFREGACSVTMERALFGYSLYTTAVFTPKVGGGKIVVENRGGSIGRLQVHPQIARFMGLLFGDLQSALARDTKLVAKMGAIEVHDKTAVLTAP
jgi:hypothetical protein